MTESEWLTTTSELAKMRAVIRKRVTGRKLRLISAAACRLVWDEFPDPRLHQALLLSERSADGSADEADLVAVLHGANSALNEVNDRDELAIFDAMTFAVVAGAHANSSDGLDTCLMWVAEGAAELAPQGQRKATRVRIRQQLCEVLREVIGNPFRPWKGVAPFLGGGVVQPDGRTVHFTETVRQLAHGIHVDQAFDRLPILADALEESGITDAALLAHCRNETRHVRGCWALNVALERV